MPTYSYECARCGRVHEYFQAMNDPPKKKCPDCGGKLTRLISGGAGVILKGSGFHSTDYRGKGFQEAKSREEGAGKSETAKTEKSEKDKGGDKKKKGGEGTSSAPKKE